MSTTIELPKSILTKSQFKTFRADAFDDDGNPIVIVAKVRYDDECGNGHNTFAITGELYDRTRRVPHMPSVTHGEANKLLWFGASGCIHDEIAKYIPELAPFIKWHLVSSDGPMHYIANAMYYASDRDCHGLRKGEKRQILCGGNPDKPAWHMEARDAQGNFVELHTLLHKSYDGKEPPTDTYTVSWHPWCRVGEGKEPDLQAARSCAVWPDAQLEDFTKEKLEARLPALMEEFKRDVESLGFVY